MRCCLDVGLNVQLDVGQNVGLCGELDVGLNVAWHVLD